MAAPRPDAVPTTERGEEARRLVDNGALLVDVRTQSEFEAGHVQGAINVSVVGLADRLAELGPKERQVIVYCRSGHRSAAAAAILRDAGFARVFDLGSIKNW
ncbi:MAG: rhodanese-like domain-containing protein [Myxococcales bacterium]